MAGTAQPRQYTAQDNANARKAILAQAIDRWQSVYTYQGTPPVGYAFQIPLQNVGLNKRLLVKFSAVITGAAGKTYNLGPLGLAAFFSFVTFTDLANYQRINTPGYHLHLVNSQKARFCYGASINKSATDNPFNFGSNWTNIQTAAAQMADATPQTVYGYLEVPISYSDFDLRGAVFANVLNATFNLQLTINPNLFVISTADPTFALYQSTDATVPTLGQVNITVYQNYLDQLPQVQTQNGAQYVLPLGDLGVAYLWNWTQQGPLAQNQDNSQFYANFRNFMSTLMIYDNNKVLTQNGTDINYLSLRTANLTNIMQVDPTVPALWTRLRGKQDMPSGIYYFDHRKRPIATAQYGNQAMVTNPITANASSFMYFGYEMLGNIAQVLNAGSQPGT